MKKASTIKPLVVVGTCAGMLLALLAGINYFLTEAEFDQGGRDASLINISGRQRVLLKSTTLYSLQLGSSKDREGQNALRDKLHQDIDLMDRAHAGLINPKQGKLSKETESIYFGPSYFLDRQLKNYIAEVRDFLADPEKELSDHNVHLLNILAVSQSELIDALDSVVRQYQKESESNKSRLHNLQKGMLTVILIVLLAMALFIFAPMVKRIIEETNRLEESEERLANAQRVASLGNWEYNLINNSLWWSDEIFRIFGLDPDKTSLSYETFINNVHPDDREELKKEVGSNLPYRSDYRIIIPGGDIRYIHEEVRLERDDDGTVTGMWGTAQDITGQKELETELNEFKQGLEEMVQDRTAKLSSSNTQLYSEALRRTNAEEKFKSIFNNASDAIFIADTESGLILDANKKAAELLQIPIKEIAGLHFTDVHPEEDNESYEKVFRESVLKERLMSADLFLLSSEGKRIPVEISTNVFDLEGKKVIQGIFRDITDRKRSEEKVRESEKRLAEAQRIAHLGNWEWNIEKKTLYWSDETYRIFGLKPEEFELSYEAFLRTVHTDDREFVEISVVNALHEKESYNIDHRIILPDLTERIVHEQAEVVCDERGHPLRMVGTIQDITDRMRAEEALLTSQERYTLAMDVANEGIWDRNLVTGEIYYSPRWKEMLGYHDDDILNSYEEWTKRLHPDDLERVLKNQEEHLEGKTELYINEYRLRHKDGSYRWVMAKGATIKDDNGKPTRFAGSHTDITERKLMEEELVKTQKLESVGILAGGIAHDFNNILTAIVNNVYFAKEMIVEGVDVDDIVKLLESANDACFRAKDLTKQLLTFSKGGAPVLKTVLIGELIKESAEFALRGSSAKASYDIPDDLWPVDIDEGQISQVINNLIINATQAMPKGGIIEVGAENLAVSHTDNLLMKKGRYIMLAIKDSGKGISQEIIDKIFDPYFSTKEEGSGLGLSTSYSVINNHKGILNVASEEGKGATFYIYLPASQNTVEVCEEGKKGSGKCGGRILVLEDDEAIVKTLRYILNKAGFEAEYSTDGKETIQIYKKAMKSGKRFDAVMLDLTIPGGMGGKESMKKLKSIDPDIKAIVCSGYSENPVTANYDKYGFSDFISKPYQIYEIREKLSKLIHG